MKNCLFQANQKLVITAVLIGFLFGCGEKTDPLSDSDDNKATGTDSEFEGDSDTDPNGNGDAGSDGDVDADTDVDTDADTDADADGDVDTGPDDCYFNGQTFSSLTTGYDKNGEGDCRLPTPAYYATVSNRLYESAQACGRCVHVMNRTTGVSIDALVAARCPDGSESWCRSESDDVSLDTAAFEILGGTQDEPLETDWYYIPCEGGDYETVTYRFEGGANPFWFALQIRNHRNPVAAVEIQQESGWVSAARQDYNYWVIEQGCGEGPFTVKVTDIFGNELIDDGIPLTVNQDIDGAAQFPACATQAR
jgi:hypothetical protein